MQLILVDQPEGLPVDLEAAKEYLRVDLDTEDDLITGLIKTATRRLDGNNGLLGRCLLTQTWRMVVDRFDREIVLPLSPAQSVSTITYVEANGDTQTLPPSDYQVIGIDSADRVTIRPAYGKSWPAVRLSPESVAITFIAGYGDADDVPEPIVTAIKVHIALLFENRETPADLPQGYFDLIDDYRIRSF